MEPGEKPGDAMPEESMIKMGGAEGPGERGGGFRIVSYRVFVSTI